MKEIDRDFVDNAIEQHEEDYDCRIWCDILSDRAIAEVENMNTFEVRMVPAGEQFEEKFEKAMMQTSEKNQ